jgi:hypothetical protein
VSTDIKYPVEGGCPVDYRTGSGSTQVDYRSVIVDLLYGILASTGGYIILGTRKDPRNNSLGSMITAIVGSAFLIVGALLLLRFVSYFF